MAGGNETLEELEYLNAYLSGDPELMANTPGGVFTGVAPDETPMPYVVIGPPVNGGLGDVVGANPSDRIMHWGLYDCKIIGTEDMLEGQIAPAASRLDYLLQKSNGASTNALILAVYRDSGSFAYPEPANGVTYWHVGGTYRVGCQLIP